MSTFPSFRLVPLVGAAALSALIAACAPTADGGPDQTAAASGPRECFFVNRVNGFTDGGDGRSINVTVSRDEAYQLSALGYCPDIDWAQQVALEPDGSGISLCTGDLATVVTRPAGGQLERCRVRVARKIDTDEAR